MNPIVVVGPGALGCLFASKFYQAGMKVILVDYNKQRASLLRQQGVIVETEAECRTSCPDIALEVPADDVEMILILTKAYDTGNIYIPPGRSAIVTLQNGLGNAEFLAERFGTERIFAGATTEAATGLAPGHIRYVAKGKTILGSWGGIHCDSLLNLFHSAGFDIEHSDNPRKTIWRKAIVNAAINPLTALLQVKNGLLIELPESRRIMKHVVEEALVVARSEGFEFNEDMILLTETICHMTKDNISSMLQDIKKNKRTEIDALSGEIYHRAKMIGVNLPMTHAMFNLVRAKETIQ